MSAAGATTAPVRRASAAASAPLPAPRHPEPTRGARSRAQLSIVASRPAAPGRTPFAVLVGAIMLTGLMALLLVHTLAAQDAFRVHDLNQRLATLKDSEQRLSLATEQAASPTALRSRALALGMRPSTIGGYRHAKDGRVVGTLVAIPAPVIAPVPVTTPTPKPGKKSAAKSKTTTTSKPGTKSKAAAKSAKGSNPAHKAPAKPDTGHAGHHAAGHTGASAH